MKKTIILVIASLVAVACGPMKISDLREIGIQNQTCVLYFSRTLTDPIRLVIDGKPVPIAQPASGRRLEVSNLPVGEHKFQIDSDFYIVSEPIRTFEYNPEKGQVIQVYAVRKYLDETAPNREEQPGIFKRTWNGMLFWRKQSAQDEAIDTTGIYAEFAD